MTRIKSTLALLGFATLTFAQRPPATMPSWLTPFPGAKVTAESSSATLIETDYATTAKSEEVLAHYRQLFEGASVRFAPNSDGIGLSIRAAVPECDLLIRVREEEAGTETRVNCAAKRPKPVPVVAAIPQAAVPQATSARPTQLEAKPAPRPTSNIPQRPTILKNQVH